eukprot:gene31916-22005_t
MEVQALELLKDAQHEIDLRDAALQKMQSQLGQAQVMATKSEELFLK